VILFADRRCGQTEVHAERVATDAGRSELVEMPVD